MAYQESVEYKELPTSVSRTRGRLVTQGGFSVEYVPTADSENVRYIMGHLKLPPGGIKDREFSRSCTHTMTIVSAQHGAMEVAIADSEDDFAEAAVRFLLSPGDLFRVPPGNFYRLENHSKTTECLLTWTMIYPYQGTLHEEAASASSGKREGGDERFELV